MKQVIKTLSLSVNLMMILVFLFILVTGHSMFKTVSSDQGLWFGRFEYRELDNSFILSLPYYINNTGYFNISKVELITRIEDENNVSITESATSIPEVEKFSKKLGVHEITVSLQDLASKSPHLLFNESELTLTHILGFSYAYVYSFRLDVQRVPFSWFPPFHNLSIRDIRYDLKESRLITLIYFENLSPMTLKGKLLLKVLDRNGALLGVGAEDVEIHSGTVYSENLKIDVKEHTTLREVDRIEFYFETETYSIGPVTVYD